MKKPIVILLLIVLCLLLSCCAVNAYKYDDSRRYTAGGTTVEGRVERIDLSWIDGSVTIGYHTGEGVRLSEECDWWLDKEQELHWWLDGGTLYVKYAQSGFRLSRNLEKQLTVLLPEGMTPDQLTINAVSADVTVEDVAVEKLDLNTVSGNASMTLIRVKDVNANAVSGSLHLRFGRVPDTIDVSAVSGDVTIVLPEDEGFRAEVSTVSGSVTGNLAMARDGRTYTCGSGRSRIDVNTVSGNVRLDAAK